MKSYHAILFDFDGVLAQTMEDNFSAWQQAFAAHDIVIQDRIEYFLLEGMNPQGIAEHFLRKHRRDLQLAKAIAQGKDQLYLARHDFKLYDGAVPLLSRLQEKGLALGLVTGASAKRIENTLAASLRNLFSVTVTGDDVGHCKPDPQPYQRAAEKLNCRAGECLVVENAPLGISSAKQAGMDCVAVCSTLAKSYLRDADFVVTDLAAVEKLLMGSVERIHE